MKQFFDAWRGFRRLDEGGNKSLKTRDVSLTPELVKKTVGIYKNVINDWNRYLKKQNEPTVKALQPVGSVSYYEKDLKEKPGTIYGDIDYLVEFPLDSNAEDDTNKRKEQNASKRKYIQLFVDYLKSDSVSPYIDVEETLKGNVLLVILKLEDGVYVQADTVITFPEYGDWMSGRYVPERGIKGYATGHLYTSLGNFFPLSIGTEGVIARTLNGELVTGKVRKGVEIKTISTNPQRFLIDIAKNFTGPSATMHSLLIQNSGIDSSNVSIENFSKGILGLALTLEQNGVVDAGDMIDEILNTYSKKLQSSVDDKKNISIKKETSLREQGYDEGYIRNFLKKEQENIQKMLIVNQKAIELFKRGVNQ